MILCISSLLQMHVSMTKFKNIEILIKFEKDITQHRFAYLVDSILSKQFICFAKNPQKQFK